MSNQIPAVYYQMINESLPEVWRSEVSSSNPDEVEGLDLVILVIQNYLKNLMSGYFTTSMSELSAAAAFEARLETEAERFSEALRQTFGDGVSTQIN